MHMNTHYINNKAKDLMINLDPIKPYYVCFKMLLAIAIPYDAPIIYSVPFFVGEYGWLFSSSS